MREFVEFILRSGDIDTRFLSAKRAQEGIRLHQKLQGAYPPSFQSEVFLEGDYPHLGYTLHFEGRADGLEEASHTIDEIKSTLYSEQSLREKPNPLHWAQLKFYGWMYGEKRGLEEVHLRLSYIHVETEEVFSPEKTHSVAELRDFVGEVVARFWKIQELINDFEKIRDQSIAALEFPYPQYRRGQRQMAVAVYRMIEQGEGILIEAPTGIGKTLASIFPSVKAMGQGLIKGIYYATGRNTHKLLARDAHLLLKKRGLRMKSVVLTAREKICINEVFECNPTACPYAKGHYDRVLEGVMDLYQREDVFDLQALQDCGKKHRVCPFELALDMSDLSELIIGDYNYIFHPKGYIQRLMERKSRTMKMALLVDEAHNLTDRGREMYSQDLSAGEISLLFEGKFPKRLQLAAEDAFDEVRLLSPQGELSHEKLPGKCTAALLHLQEEMGRYLAQLEEEPREDVMELYFRLSDFLHLLDFYNPRDFTIFVPRPQVLEILCLNPAQVLKNRRDRFKSCIYFSATLRPFSYHREIFGEEEAKVMAIPSPFDPGQLLILHVPEISTKYSQREVSLPRVVEYMRHFTGAHRGNYLYFFPSYAYLELVQRESHWDEHQHIQSTDFTEREREEFIERFFTGEETHGYAVMGGAFSEGIDLKGEALEGAVIVTIALPAINPRRNLIQRRYTLEGKNGFDYAYTIPGMMKVLQAAGRIIRSEEDRGALLLLDQRFQEEKIRSLLPREWRIQEVHSPAKMEQILENFWKE